MAPRAGRMPQTNYGAEFSNCGYLPLKGATRQARGPPAGGRLGNAFPGGCSLNSGRASPSLRPISAKAADRENRSALPRWSGFGRGWRKHWFVRLRRSYRRVISLSFKASGPQLKQTCPASTSIRPAKLILARHRWHQGSLHDMRGADIKNNVCATRRVGLEGAGGEWSGTD